MSEISTVFYKFRLSCDSSSAISQVTYDRPSQELTIVFTSSEEEFVYEGVPSDVALILISSKSIGTSYNLLIRGKYPIRKKTMSLKEN